MGDKQRGMSLSDILMGGLPVPEGGTIEEAFEPFSGMTLGGIQIPMKRRVRKTLGELFPTARETENWHFYPGGRDDFFPILNQVQWENKRPR